MSHIGDRHFLYVSGLNNLGLLYQDLNRYEEAAALHRLSLEILEKTRGSRVAYGTTLSNLAEACKGLGRNDEVEDLIEEALGIFEEVVGKGHSLYGSSLNNLAAFCYDQQKYEKARALFAASLQICEQSYGRKSKYYASSITNLGIANEKSGRLDEARQCYESALAINLALFGEDSLQARDARQRIAALR